MAKAVAKVEEVHVPAPQPAVEADSLLNLIERAARDPNVDIDKMERLMAMKERMDARQAEADFNAGLALMQVEFPEMPERGTIKNKAGGVQSTYTLWEDLNQIIKPILSKHRFALTFRTGNENGKIVVTGVLSHAGGHSVSSTMQVPLDTSGSKNDVQGLGSSTAYGKRYVAGALLNLTSRGQDDDGSGGKLLDKSQKEGFLEAMELVDNIEKWQALWEQIIKATTAAGDVKTHEELRSLMAKRRKEVVA